MKQFSSEKPTLKNLKKFPAKTKELVEELQLKKVLKKKNRLKKKMKKKKNSISAPYLTKIKNS